MMIRVLFLSLALGACTCDDPEPAGPGDGLQTQVQQVPEAQAAPIIAPEELESRRGQVIKQVDDLRAVELEMGDLFGLVTIADPVPAQVPGIEAHEWTAADTEATSDLSWSPRSGGGGKTYAQFQIEVSEDGQHFTIRATMDLDGDGHVGTVIATDSQAAEVQDVEVW